VVFNCEIFFLLGMVMIKVIIFFIIFFVLIHIYALIFFSLLISYVGCLDCFLGCLNNGV
jgi:hypothetical protein